MRQSRQRVFCVSVVAGWIFSEKYFQWSAPALHRCRGGTSRPGDKINSRIYISCGDSSMPPYDFESWAEEEISQIQMGVQLRAPSENQSMFKYISLNSDISWNMLEETLSSSYLTGSPVTRLNDPFELAPSVFDDLQPTTIAAAVGHNPLIYRLRDKGTKALSELFVDTEKFRNDAHSYFDIVKNIYRICAFCERSDSGLLWAHYANSYKGACLHFLAKGFRSFHNSTIGYVNYSNYRPTYPLSLALSLFHSSDIDKRSRSFRLKKAESDKLLFFTKSYEWAYESELRIIYQAVRSESVRFEKDGLVSIIVGPRMSEECREKLISIVKKHHITT